MPARSGHRRIPYSVMCVAVPEQLFKFAREHSCVIIRYTYRRKPWSPTIYSRLFTTHHECSSPSVPCLPLPAPSGLRLRALVLV